MTENKGFVGLFRRKSAGISAEPPPEDRPAIQATFFGKITDPDAPLIHHENRIEHAREMRAGVADTRNYFVGEDGRPVRINKNPESEGSHSSRVNIFSWFMNAAATAGLAFIVADTVQNHDSKSAPYDQDAHVQQDDNAPSGP